MLIFHYWIQSINNFLSHGTEILLRSGSQNFGGFWKSGDSFSKINVFPSSCWHHAYKLLNFRASMPSYLSDESAIIVGRRSRDLHSRRLNNDHYEPLKKFWYNGFCYNIWCYVVFISSMQDYFAWLETDYHPDLLSTRNIF